MNSTKCNQNLPENSKFCFSCGERAVSHDHDYVNEKKLFQTDCPSDRDYCWDSGKPVFIGFAGRFKKRVVADPKERPLEWYVGPGSVTWDEAKSYAENLNVAGGGWRLPTLKELEGLYQKEYRDRDKTLGFGPFFCNYPLVWSGELKDSEAAWHFSLIDGESSLFYRTDNLLKGVLAVRVQ